MKVTTPIVNLGGLTMKYLILALALALASSAVNPDSGKSHNTETGSGYSWLTTEAGITIIGYNNTHNDWLIVISSDGIVKRFDIETPLWSFDAKTGPSPIDQSRLDAELMRRGLAVD